MLDKRKKKKLKAIFIAIISFLVALSLLLTFIFTSLVKDKSRSSHVDTGISYSEIIRKNFINGFKDTYKDGQFSFSLENEDINELLSNGLKKINDKHIQNIYYETKDDHHYFYVDLTKVVIKARVVIDLVKSPTFLDGNSYLVINRCSIGKVDAINYLQKKGYLTSNWINEYFKKCELPISYNEDTLSFVINASTFIDYFPSTKLGDILFSLVKEKRSKFILENSSLFGFNVDFTSLATLDEFSNIDTSSEPLIYDSIKSGCESIDLSMMCVDESRVGYSLSTSNLDILLNKVIGNSKLEEVNSLYTSNKVYFDLKGISTSLEESEKIKIKLYYSLNGYLIRVDEELAFLDVSNASKFKGVLEARYTLKINEYTFTSKEDKYVTYFINELCSLLLDVSSLQSNIFNFDTSLNSLYIDSQDMNKEFSDPSLKYSLKSIKVNIETKSIDFMITKTV